MTLGINLSRVIRNTSKASLVALTIGLVTTVAGVKYSLAQQKVKLLGSGASFPAPLYQRWFKDFKDVSVDYQSKGSGAGVRDFTQELVDFGASDVAMKDDEIAKVKRGVIMLPMTAGSVVLAYNVPGVSNLKLSRAVYVDIFLGKIKNWNDAKIQAINSGVNLPNLPITVVHRSDGSGTTGVFTKHLSAISPEWKSKVGEGKTVQWPTGVGGAKNDGVAAQIKQIKGGIGYIEFGFAKSAGLPTAALQNKAGKYVSASQDSVKATLAAVKLPGNLRAFISDPDGANSYPIATYTWMLMYSKYDGSKGVAIEKMVEYGLNEGQKVSAELGYIPLPNNVRQTVAAAADKISSGYQIKLK
ncbi:phosphate ABC transporter substrate-binding protein PstS [Okeania sp.]|uniref:phosphate ABC transporter substrate-binding protein PstS n=1 Tax=Okeania sp. TaxID=3100323 RepID=UPI002B4B6D3B|nr:phosphate ABC transporter substrate-binding protein PstS [Okeania sp.]MEB3343510.1 phosphate ABC transporter substrate-binding protein PstS [Okeania sp.]